MEDESHTEKCEACRSLMENFLIELAKKDARIKELEDINAVINSHNFGKVIAERIHEVVEAKRQRDLAVNVVNKLRAFRGPEDYLIGINPGPELDELEQSLCEFELEEKPNGK